MASKTTYKCDICEREIPFEHNKLEIVLGDRTKGRGDLKMSRFYDLCEHCSERFMRMFNAFKHNQEGEEYEET